MNRAVVALGSNIDPEAHIEQARALMASSFEVIAESRFVKTDPVGFADQPPFINGALLVQTRLSYAIFLKRLKEMERRLGRKRSPEKFGPRVIDLDVAVWNDRIVDKDVYTRSFLRTSVTELIPDIEIKPCLDT